MMRVLKDFKWSADGVTARQAVAGGDVDLPSDLIAGLRNEGFVEDVPAAAHPPANPTLPAGDSAPATETVEIPEDWPTLHHMVRIKLAKQITADPVENAAAADLVIAAELERRAAA